MAATPPGRSIPISVRLPADLLAEADAVAAADDRTRTSLITAALRAYLATRDADAAQQRLQLTTEVA